MPRPSKGPISAPPCLLRGGDVPPPLQARLSAPELLLRLSLRLSQRHRCRGPPRGHAAELHWPPEAKRTSTRPAWPGCPRGANLRNSCGEAASSLQSSRAATTPCGAGSQLWTRRGGVRLLDRILSLLCGHATAGVRRCGGHGGVGDLDDARAPNIAAWRGHARRKPGAARHSALWRCAMRFEAEAAGSRQKMP